MSLIENLCKYIQTRFPKPAEAFNVQSFFILLHRLNLFNERSPPEAVDMVDYTC